MKTTRLIFLLVLTLFGFLSCKRNDGTSTGNPLVNLRSGVYSNLSIQTVTESRFCFKRLRFKQAGELTNSDPTVDEDNIDFSIGEKILNAGGDNFGTVAVPPGNYTRIEFDLADVCGTGNSVYLQNSSGTYTSNQTITIKFSGNITINADVSVELALQNLIGALNTVTNSSQIRPNLEAVSGAY